VCVWPRAGGLADRFFTTAARNPQRLRSPQAAWITHLVFPGLTRSRVYAYRGCCRRHREWRGWPDSTYRGAAGEPRRCETAIS